MKSGIKELLAVGKAAADTRTLRLFLDELW